MAFLVIAAFLLTNKVYSPQYVLWLLPLMILARPQWRDWLIFTAGELIYFVAIWWHLGGLLAPGDSSADRIYWLAVRDQVVHPSWVVIMVVRDALRPEHDPVRREGVDDPTGGVLDRRPMPAGSRCSAGTTVAEAECLMLQRRRPASRSHPAEDHLIAGADRHPGVAGQPGADRGGRAAAGRRGAPHPHRHGQQLGRPALRQAGRRRLLRRAGRHLDGILPRLAGALVAVRLSWGCRWRSAEWSSPRPALPSRPLRCTGSAARGRRSRGCLRRPRSSPWCPTPSRCSAPPPSGPGSGPVRPLAGRRRAHRSRLHRTGVRGLPGRRTAGHDLYQRPARLARQDRRGGADADPGLGDRRLRELSLPADRQLDGLVLTPSRPAGYAS